MINDCKNDFAASCAPTKDVDFKTKFQLNTTHALNQVIYKIDTEKENRKIDAENIITCDECQCHS